jgi:periplasmic divalent cation tolerance protein
VSTGVLVALTTFPTAERAGEVARTLVGEGLVACVNIVPGVRSIYAWKGEISDDAEVLCVLKTRSDRLEALRARLVALHPYEVPELVVLEVTGGHEPYLAWVLGAAS